MRHQAGVVDDHVDAAVRLHRVIDKALDLLAVGHVGLHRRRPRPSESSFASA